MIDPVTAIGLVAAVQQLAAAAGTFVLNIYEYYEAIKDAPEQSRQLRQEMASLLQAFNSKKWQMSWTP